MEDVVAVAAVAVASPVSLAETIIVVDSIANTRSRNRFLLELRTEIVDRFIIVCACVCHEVFVDMASCVR